MFHKKQNKEPFKGIQPDMAPKQMETVQQHEWVKVKARYSNTWKQCIHCGNCHETEQSNYVSPNGEYLKEEPACITRPAKEGGNNGR